MLRRGDPNESFGPIVQGEATDIGDSMLGDYEVGIGRRERNRWGIEARDDA